MLNVGKIISIFILCNALAIGGWSQACTTLGQTIFTSFPVCGDSVFIQNTVPVCLNGVIPTKCANGITYDDRNPYWYRFTCYKSGKLGLIINPKISNDDYDWQIFDITGRNPADVYTDPSLIVCYNWSGLSGNTGTTPQGQNIFECGSPTNPPTGPSPFSAMPDLIIGHQYALMISHFSGTNQSGYSLSFPVGGSQGGTAIITDPTLPTLQNAYGICDGTEIVVKLSKKMKCNSLAANGTDFTVSGTVPVSIASASGFGCNAGFDSDSILLKLNTILAPGSYTVWSQVGTDGNSLIDNCDNNMAAGLQSTLKFFGTRPTPMDSIKPVICITDTLQLVFNRPMNCNSIAPDGSDFVITGPIPVTVKSASGICNNGISTIVNIFLTKPIRVNGTFTLLLKKGTDGNPLLDECGFITPAGSSITFTTKNITTADFQSTVAPGCKFDTVYLTHNGYGGTTQWQWKVDSAVVSNIQNPVLVSKAFGPHSLQLAVNNGFCSDTARSSFVFVDQTVKASFAVADTLCPTDTLHFTDLSSPNTTGWRWDFGNGVTSTRQTPPAQSYPLTGRPSNYTARLTVQNNFNCTDIAYKILTVLASCYIAVPSAFTPNGDGLNDYLYPLNAFKADNLYFRVYNRYGQIIFETRDWTRKWDGRVNGNPQGSGTYVWTFSYTDRNTGQKVALSGTTVLIR